MPTQLYLGEELEAREASQEEVSKLVKRKLLKKQIKELSEEIAEIDESLPKKTALIADITEEENTVTRTYIIDEPKGTFVNYKKLDMVMDTKTTKKLLKEFNRT